MKRNRMLFGIALGLVLSAISFAACSSDDGGSSDNVTYRLKYKGIDWYPHISWNGLWANAHLTLEFDDGIPKGSEWRLECDASWIKLRNNRGKVSTSVQNIPITIESNINYDDREGVIFLDVTNGIPVSSGTATVRIHQYGMEHYLSYGKSISFTTNRSDAESSELTIEKLSVLQVMEIDWGDGSKEYKTVVDYEAVSNLSVSHEYRSNKTYTVKLRFAPYEDSTLFGFRIRKNQGIGKFNYNYNGTSTSHPVDASKTTNVSYSDKSGFSISQY